MATVPAGYIYKQGLGAWYAPDGTGPSYIDSFGTPVPISGGFGATGPTGPSGGPTGPAGTVGATGPAGSSASPTLVAYSSTIPLDGNKYSTNHTVTTTEALALGAVAEGSSYYVNMIGDGSHTPTWTPFALVSGSDTYNTTANRINLLAFGYMGGNAYVIVKDTGLTYVAAPVFSAQSAPAGQKGTAYTYTFVASGAASYAFASGTLPTGLSLNTSTGVLSGTPTATGTSTFVISATNAGGTTNSTSQSVNIIVAAPVFSAQSAPGGTNGTAYTYTYAASDTTSFAVASGTLPTGLTLNTSTGVLSGTPSSTATFTFVISATGGGGTTNSTSQSVVIAAAATGFADNFNRANAGTLGTPWVQSGGAMAISGNKAFATGKSNSIAVVETGLANSTITLTPSCDTTGAFVDGQTGSSFGIYFRYVDANNYWRWTCFGNWYSQIDRCVSGTTTTIVGVSNTVQPNTVRMQVVTSGSSLTFKVDTGSGFVTATGLSVTDSTFSTATKAGMWISMTQNQYFDDFSAA